MKLLIVDDHSEMRAFLRRVCAPLVSEIHDCADGDEAIQLFAQFQPDWTIMDLAMPRLDGLTATRLILAGHPGARIAVLTRFRGPEYEQAARQAGACAFVHKEDLQPLLALLSSSASAQAIRPVTNKQPTCKGKT